MAEGKTVLFDYDKGEFITDSSGRVLTVEDGAALSENVIKAFSTPRGVYPIYANPEEPELDHKYGSDVVDIATRSELTEEARTSELKRAIREALIYDPWITDVKDIRIYTEVVDGVRYTKSAYTLETLFDTQEQTGVVING